MVGLGFWVLLGISLFILIADLSPYIKEMWSDYKEWKEEERRDKEYHGKHEKRS